MTSAAETTRQIQIGDLFTDHVQPYGARTIRVERIDINGDPAPSYYGAYGPQCIMTLHGTVTEGIEISRLFQHTSRQDITGRRHTVYGVYPRHWAAREKITAVCG